MIPVLVVCLLGGSGVLFLTGAGSRIAKSVRTARHSRVPRPSVADQRVVVEAVATWTENLRDTVSAAAGIEQALIATERHAPKAIAGEVRRLVSAIRYGSMEDGLRRFADDVAHPTCDFVVAALVTTCQHQTRDVTALLGHLAQCARAECDLYLRVWVSRARTRTAVRIITAAVVVFVLGLVLFNPVYLSPFMCRTGLVALVVDIAMFVIALRWLHKMGAVATPARFLHGRSNGRS